MYHSHPISRIIAEFNWKNCAESVQLRDFSMHDKQLYTNVLIYLISCCCFFNM
jgi:hypothetical protein